MVFTGDLRPQSFSEFVQHRAEKLALNAAVESAGPETVVLTVHGDPDLVDAFEMACSLGPLDCLVRECAREATPTGPETAP